MIITIPVRKAALLSASHAVMETARIWWPPRADDYKHGIQVLALKRANALSSVLTLPQGTGDEHILPAEKSDSDTDCATAANPCDAVGADQSNISASAADFPS